MYEPLQIYSPSSFDVITTVKNIGFRFLENLEAEIQLPPQLYLLSGAQPTRRLVLPARIYPFDTGIDSGFVAWHVAPREQSYAQTVAGSIRVTIPNSQWSRVGSFSVFLPALKITSVTDDAAPRDAELFRNYPNPVTEQSSYQTTIRFYLPNAVHSRKHVTLIIYDLFGRRAGELVSGEMDSGYHSFPINLMHLASGTYIYRLTTDKTSIAKTFVIAK